jgi:hypothetical protein
MAIINTAEYQAQQSRGQDFTGGLSQGGGAGGAGDPSNVYRDKLTSMMQGQFSPSDPSYDFRFKQGQQALERSQASKGLLGSGAAAQELVQYGQGMASTEYGAQFNRLLQGMQGVESQYSAQQTRLMELAGIKMKQEQLGLQRDEFGLAESKFGAEQQQQQYENLWKESTDAGIGAGLEQYGFGGGSGGFV